MQLSYVRPSVADGLCLEKAGENDRLGDKLLSVETTRR